MRQEAAQLWAAVRRSHAEYETHYMPWQRDGRSRMLLDLSILQRPRDGTAARLLGLLDLDSPEALIALYAQSLQPVPFVGPLRANRVPGLGATVDKNNMLALLAGLPQDEQLEVLQVMAEIEHGFWSAPGVTRYLTERRAGGLREIPPALLARHAAIRTAVAYLQRRIPQGELVRLAGVGVGSGDEMMHVALALLARGRDVEICALEWSDDLVAEANAELRKAGVDGHVVQGNMDRADDLQYILDQRPHLLIDHWAGCYDSLVVQKARYAFIRERSQTAILSAVLTDDWNVGRMIRGERVRNIETMQALAPRLDEVDGGLIDHEGKTYFAYPSQLRLARRLRQLGTWPAIRVSALYGWLSTLLPAEMALGPLTFALPDGQDALRISAPYGAALQVRTCRYPLPALESAASAMGWRTICEESTLFDAGAVLVLVP